MDRPEACPTHLLGLGQLLALLAQHGLAAELDFIAFERQDLDQNLVVEIFPGTDGLLHIRKRSLLNFGPGTKAYEEFIEFRAEKLAEELNDFIGLGERRAGGHAAAGAV